MGGGKAMDTAKLVKRDTPGLKLTAIPTSAATCAAFSAVSVVYDRAGVYSHSCESPQADNVIIDYSIFEKLPKQFFAAGAMDTLAKYYETAVYKKKLKLNGLYDDAVLEHAKFFVKRLKDIIFKKWYRLDAETKRELTDINIVLSGMVSTLGKYTVTSSTAHTLSYALTCFAKAREFLHGEHVGLGLIIQEEAAGNIKNVQEIDAMAQVMEVPRRFWDFGAKKEDLAAIFEFYSRLNLKETPYVPVQDELMYKIFEKYMV
jgi:uncharacterized oxidoreductase